jgi:hypothetical protein
MKKIEKFGNCEEDLKKIVNGIKKGMGKSLKKGREAILFEFIVEPSGKIVDISATILKNKNEYLSNLAIKGSKLRYIG